MAQRTWGYVTVTGSAQPLFATTLSAAFVLKTDGVGVSLVGQTLALTSAAKFNKGDRIMLVETNGTLTEFCTIASISTNNVVVESIKYSHSSGCWVILDESATGIYVQCQENNSAKIGIGNGLGINLTTGANLIAVLEKTSTGVQPTEFVSSNVFGSNPVRTSDFWAIGTASDYFLPSFNAT